MKIAFEKTAAWAIDGAVCSMMNALQWRRRGDTCTLKKFDDYIETWSSATREEFYHMPPATTLQVRDEWIEWASPLPSGLAENDRARVRYYGIQKRGAPTLLLLHALMSASDFGYRRLATWFNLRGWNVAFPHLPYHYTRTPKRTLNGELAITADLIRNVEGLRQAVVELRQLMSLLRAQGSQEFAIIGTSYGGWTGALLSFLEKDFRFLALVQPIVNVEKAVWENPGAASMRRYLRARGHVPGGTMQFAHLSSPLHGIPLCDYTRIVIASGLYDRISPIEDLMSLTEKWPGSKLIKVRQGHFGYRALRETLREIEPFVSEN